MSIHIVVADDAPFIREVVRNLLQNTEIQIVGEAANGIEVVELVESIKPHVVLMDLVMPYRSGIEAAEIIKEKMPEVKILACSTVDQETMALKAIEAGCSDYLVKPFKSEELILAIRKLME